MPENRENNAENITNPKQISFWPNIAKWIIVFFVTFLPLLVIILLNIKFILAPELYVTSLIVYLILSLYLLHLTIKE